MLKFYRTEKVQLWTLESKIFQRLNIHTGDICVSNLKYINIRVILRRSDKKVQKTGI